MDEILLITLSSLPESTYIEERSILLEFEGDVTMITNVLFVVALVRYSNALIPIGARLWTEIVPIVSVALHKQLRESLQRICASFNFIAMSILYNH